MNPFKSLFNKTPVNKTPEKTDDSNLGAAQPASQQEMFSPGSPHYAYAFQSPYKKPRILVLVDDVRATYFLSFHYVLERLHKTESLAFFVLDSAEVSRWTAARSPAEFAAQVIDDVQPTLVIFSRYGLPYGDELLGLFKAQNIATVCHMDDDLLNIDPDLGKEIQARQGNPAVLRSRQILLQEADLIYASTAALGDRFSTQFPEQSIFHGIYAPYPDFLLSGNSQKPKKQPLTIGYMGSKGHQEDLGAIADDIVRILIDYPQARFEIFGTIALPAVLEVFEGSEQEGERDQISQHTADTDYAGFLNKLQGLNWDIGLAPLQDTGFNRCKAPTKYIEYTACGIPTIASSLHVYSQFEPQAQILTAQPGEWYSKIQQLIEDVPLRRTLVANGQAVCAQKFSLNILENQIKELIALA